MGRPQTHLQVLQQQLVQAQRDAGSIVDGDNSSYFLEVATAHSGKNFRGLKIVTAAAFTKLLDVDGLDVRKDRNLSISGIGTLTGTTIATGNTVVIGSKTYTFQATLTDVDGNVHVGATDQDSINNLIAAINLDGTGEIGVDFAAAMTVNTDVTAAAGGTDGDIHFRHD